MCVMSYGQRGNVPACLKNIEQCVSIVKVHAVHARIKSLRYPNVLEDA